MKTTLIASLLGLLCSVGYTQNETDALRYADVNFAGTARSAAMGGAFSTVGADISAIGINPASMGRFSKSEFNFTPTFGVNESSTVFNEKNSEDSRFNVAISNIGFVGTHNFSSDKISGWKSVQFGLTYNRLNNFNEDIVVSGETDNSMSLVFANWAQGATPENLPDWAGYDGNLAYNTYLIDPDPTNDQNYLAYYNGENTMTRQIKRQGRMGQTDFSLSGNYEDKLYLGMSIGIPNIKFKQTSTHREEVPLDTAITDLSNFTYKEQFETKGSGANLKIGAIFLPTDWLRIGGSIQTRSIYRLTDRWSNDMETNFTNGDHYTDSSALGTYSYTLRTPFRANLGASIILLKRVVLSVDYETVDHGKSKLKSDAYGISDYDFATENAAITTSYKRVHNFKAGAEIKINPQFLVRAGAQLRQNPVLSNNTPQFIYSAGLGFRYNNMYVDIAGVTSKASEAYYAYDANLISKAEINKLNYSVMTTVGFRF